MRKPDSEHGLGFSGVVDCMSEAKGKYVNERVFYLLWVTQQHVVFLNV